MICSCFGASSDHAVEDLEGHLLRNIKNFSYTELIKATDNFHPTNKIGQGGFGIVYKGILKNGVQVAVKTLSAASKQGPCEFLTEAGLVLNIRHRNLVELIGCCVEGANRILIYEYLENNSLDSALFGPNSRTIKLNWDQRSAICKGMARGLAYLHEELVPSIVHRDIKASNILLDKDFTPKIGDFGLAKLFPDDITHITTNVRGTTGYLAPEYVLGGKLTKKVDVFSFGILILEIVSGRSSGKAKWGEMQQLLLEWSRQLYEEGQLLEMVDPELEGYPEDEITRFIKVALFCTQAKPSRRPMMSQVVHMLLGNNLLNEKEIMAPG